MAEKKSKKRADKYNEKLNVKGSFDNMMSVLFPKVKAEKKIIPVKSKAKK